MSKYVIALYIRLSVEDSKTESLSIHNQRLILHKFAGTLPEGDDAEILEFVDNGHSGTNFERPAVQELLELVRENRIDCVIVKDFTRFGRNAIDTGYFIERVFPLYRTRFISVQDDFDTANFKEDTGGMEVAFKYLISEYYSKDLSEKSKSAKYMKMQKGEYQSKICNYGYRKGANNRLEIDAEAADVVRLIFDLSLGGQSAQQIAKELYLRGIPTPGEYKAQHGMAHHDISRCHHMWQRSSVLRILSDERYIGTYIIGKRAVREVGGHKTRLKAESEWFKIPNHHPAIVEQAVYEQVQAGLQRFVCEKKNLTEYPLRGKVFCGCCCHAMYRRKKDPEFLCEFSKIDPGFACYGLSIIERELESLLYEVMSRQAAVILDIDPIGGFRELTRKLARQTGYEAQIQACNDSKLELYERFLRQEITLEEYREQKAVYDVKLKDLNRQHSALAVVTRQMQMDSDKKNSLHQTAWEVSAETGLTKALAEKLIDKVYIYPDNRVEISWKIRDFALSVSALETKDVIGA